MSVESAEVKHENKTSINIFSFSKGENNLNWNNNCKCDYLLQHLKNTAYINNKKNILVCISDPGNIVTFSKNPMP